MKSPVLNGLLLTLDEPSRYPIAARIYSEHDSKISSRSIDGGLMVQNRERNIFSWEQTIHYYLNVRKNH